MGIKKAEARIAELKAQGVEVELILVGNKGGTYFKKRATPVRKMIPCGQAPTAEQASEIANELLSSYYAGKLDRIELLYTSFVSMISSVPTGRTLVPLLPSGMEMEGDEIFKLTSKDGDIAVEKTTVPVAEPKEFAPDMIFEQEPSQLLNAILPLYLNGKLEREMNRARQAKITQELMEIIAGADATG